MGRSGLVGVREDGRGGGYEISVDAGWEGHLIMISAALVSNGSDFFMLVKFLVGL